MIDEVKLNICGQFFLLPVEYRCHTGEDVTEEQINALNNFLKHPEWMTNAEANIEKYRKEDVRCDEVKTREENILSYIEPYCVFVKRETPNPRIALMCKYRYDIEHGLAVVFTSEGKIEVGIQDIIL